MESRTHVATLESPCELIREINISNSSRKAAEYIYDKCTKLYLKKVHMTLATNCPYIPENKLSKAFEQPKQKKRIVFLTGLAVGAVLSYGVLHLYHQWDSTSVGTESAPIQNELKNKLELVNKGNKQHFMVQRKMKDELIKVWHQFDIIHQMMDDDLRLNAAFSSIESDIKITNLLLEKFIMGLKQGKVTTEYQQLFPENPLLKMTPLEHWKAEPCYRFGKHVLFKFTIPRMVENVKILKAETFDFMVKKEQEECLATYEGNRYVMYDLQTNCSRDLYKSPENTNRIVHVNSNYKICNDHQNKFTKDNWKVKFCSQELTPNELEDVKEDGLNYYVYCMKQTLTIRKKQTICKNVIYKLPLGTKFYLNNHEYKRSHSTSTTSMENLSYVTEMLKERIYNQSSHSTEDFIMLERLIEGEEKINSMIKWENIPLTTTTAVGGSISTIILIIIGFICLKRFKLLPTWRNANPVASVVYQAPTERIIIRNEEAKQQQLRLLV